MGLFGKKTEREQTSSCCCGGNCDAESVENAQETMSGGASVKVLGTGCAKCNELEKNVKAALEQLGMDVTVDHVTDLTQIAAMGVMSTPALVVDEKVVSYGKVLKKEDAVKLLQKIRG